MKMQGRQVVITGATSGVGRATAMALARMGAHIIAVGRNAEKGRQLLDELSAATSGIQSSFVKADLGNLDEVRAAASEIDGRTDRVDVLINNAGVINARRKVTPQGFEEVFAVNHLAHFLLTGLLLPRLEASGSARVVTVASDAHKVGRLDFDDLQSERRYSTFGVYAKSKLANILFSAELARRLGQRPITSNAVHPGFVGSGFATNNGGFARLVMQLVKPFALTPEKGAQTSVYLASSDDVAGVSGRYFYRRRPIEPARRARDDDAARRLWEVSEQLTGLRYP